MFLKMMNRFELQNCPRNVHFGAHLEVSCGGAFHQKMHNVPRETRILISQVCRTQERQHNDINAHINTMMFQKMQFSYCFLTIFKVARAEEMIIFDHFGAHVELSCRGALHQKMHNVSRETHILISQVCRKQERQHDNKNALINTMMFQQT